MKKLSLLLIISAVLLSSCGQKKNEQAKNDPTPTPTFEEFEKVDIEVKDYVEESSSPTHTTEPVQTPAANDTQSSNTTTPPKSNTTTTQKNTATNTSNEKKPSNSKPAEATQQNNLIGAESNETQKQVTDLTGKIICIDPGHGKFTENKTENIAPNSSATKAGYKEGTKGENSVEDTVTLAVANKLKDKLTALGAMVIMTRTDENSTMSNVERAQFANTNKANITIKLHADGTKEGGSGMTMLVPGSGYISDKQMLSDRKKLGKLILKNAVLKTGAINRGTYTNSQMSGLNWSEMPVVLFEMGFMTNPKDEAKLNDETYQDKIADGIKLGIIEYFN